jgi:hypothetical protein
MTLEHRGCIALPIHTGGGGFDHAAVHQPSGRVYGAHTANDALDVIDGRTGQCVQSVPDLPGVVGALVCEERQSIVPCMAARRKPLKEAAVRA